MSHELTEAVENLKGTPLVPADPLVFLDLVGRGCISGRVADWPQLKPACKWAAEQIWKYMDAARDRMDLVLQLQQEQQQTEAYRRECGRLLVELQELKAKSTSRSK